MTWFQKFQVSCLCPSLALVCNFETTRTGIDLGQGGPDHWFQKFQVSCICIMETGHAADSHVLPSKHPQVRVHN